MSEHIAKTDSRTMMRRFFQHQNDTSQEPGLAPMNIRFLALVSTPAEIRCPYSSRDFQLFLSPMDGISKPPAAYNPTVHSRRNPKPIRCPSDVVSLGDWMKKSAHASSSQELNFFFRSAHVALGIFSLQVRRTMYLRIGLPAYFLLLFPPSSCFVFVPQHQCTCCICSTTQQSLTAEVP